ncbi:hypothetical protein EDB85DRAFT_19555 [Lactarius pseudohatsudake]|nr:hypothetical protein EDB85DRAFT_19555 [Lactarius pseudohatsudake]
MLLCPSRILATSSSRLYYREISRALTTLNQSPPTAPQKPRVHTPPRAPHTTCSTDASEHPKLLQPYELSKRLVALCERCNVDLAGNMLQHAPHPIVYSALLCHLADRADSYSVGFQVVSDAKYVWRQLVRNLDEQPKHYIEPRSVDAVIKVLSRGYKSDRELMFDILRDICGLPRPGENRPPPPPKVEPNMFILDEALDSCIMASRPEMAIHYAQIVVDSPELRPIIQVWHLRKIITAHIALAEMGPPSPAHSESAATWVEWFMAQGHEDSVDIQYSLNTALMTCHHCGDMPSALRIARAVLEGPTRGCSMPALAWVYLFRLAIVAPPNDKQQCLDLLTRHDSVLDVWEWGSAIKELPEKKAHVALASRILHLLRTPLALPDSAAGGLDASDVGEFETWSDIERRAKLFLRTAQHRDYPFIRK